MDYAARFCLHLYLWLSLALLIAYLPSLVFFFVPFWKQGRLVNPVRNRIAVIVPARDESSVIRFCLDSLARQTYDPSHFDTYIVVADEADPTASIAADYANTYVYVVKDQTGKGSALDGVMKSLLNGSVRYDAYLIVDADNLAAPDLLEEMNNALSSGCQIICGKKLIKNWESSRRDSRSFISNCTALTYTQVDELGNRGRNLLGIAITMIGTGMLIRSDIVEENDGWPYRGLTEDYEMTADSILKGWKSLYYSHAKVFTEEATHAKAAYERKMRWIKGYSQCQQRHHKAIRQDMFSGAFKWRNLDFLYATYPAYAFFGISVVAALLGVVAVILTLSGGRASMATAAPLVLVPILMVYGALFVFTLIAMAVDWRYIKIPITEILAVLFIAPIYTLGYFRIFIAAFLTGYDHFQWHRTERVPFAMV